MSDKACEHEELNNVGVCLKCGSKMYENPFSRNLWSVAEQLQAENEALKKQNVLLSEKIEGMKCCGNCLYCSGGLDCTNPFSDEFCDYRNKWQLQETK